jgi:hypothetical protein
MWSRRKIDKDKIPIGWNIDHRDYWKRDLLPDDRNRHK